MQKIRQVGGLKSKKVSREIAVTSQTRTASLREDYLNQVQRDFLSRPEGQHP